MKRANKKEPVKKVVIGYCVFRIPYEELWPRRYKVTFTKKECKELRKEYPFSFWREDDIIKKKANVYHGVFTWDVTKKRRYYNALSVSEPPESEKSAFKRYWVAREILEDRAREFFDERVRGGKELLTDYVKDFKPTIKVSFLECIEDTEVEIKKRVSRYIKEYHSAHSTSHKKGLNTEEELVDCYIDWEEESGNWCVYKHTSPKGKSYIGITSLKPQYRWGKDGNRYKGQKKFYRAIKYYGWENFTHEVLKENLSQQSAWNWERYYVAFYDSYYNGYNATEGGEDFPDS